MTVVPVKTRKARTKKRAPPAPPAIAPVRKPRLRKLPAAQRIEALLARFAENARERGVPSDVAAWIEGRVKSAIAKTPSQLSEDEKRALIAFRYLAAPGGMGYDVRRESKKIARLVSSWLKAGRSDVQGVDEPTARALYGAIRSAVKRKDWSRLNEILKGGPLRVKKKVKPAPAAPTVTPAPATAPKPKKRKVKKAAPAAAPVVEVAPEEAEALEALV